jgi:hypothetical protein
LKARKEVVYDPSISGTIEQSLRASEMLEGTNKDPNFEFWRVKETQREVMFSNQNTTPEGENRWLRRSYLAVKIVANAGQGMHGADYKGNVSRLFRFCL